MLSQRRIRFQLLILQASALEIAELARRLQNAEIAACSLFTLGRLAMLRVYTSRVDRSGRTYARARDMARIALGIAPPRLLLHYPEFPDQWTFADADAADAEGWNIYEAHGVLEIERNDANDPPHEDAPCWPSDDAAVEHVRKVAAAGSALHVRALTIHERYMNQGEKECDECEAMIPDSADSMVNAFHETSCSLHPSACEVTKS